MRKRLTMLICTVMIALLSSGYQNVGGNSSVDPGESENGQMVSEGHLPDYTERYGLEPTDSVLYCPAIQTYGPDQGPVEVQYIAVFIEFPDMENYSLDNAQCVKNAEAFFSAEEGTATVTGLEYEDVPVTSLKNYVEKYSYGNCSVTASIFPKNESGTVVSYQSKKPRSYYLKYDAVTNPNGYRPNEIDDRERELIQEAVDSVKDQILSLGNDALDVNGDGILDAISFFVESEKQSDSPVGWGDLLWSHKLSGMGIRMTEDIRIDSYNLINCYDYQSPGGMFSSNRPTYGTIIHEYMHTLGFPDLYRYSSKGDPVGLYDLMASTDNTLPQGLLTYMLSEYYDLGWHGRLEEITSSKQGITLTKPTYQNSSEKCAVKVRSPFNSNEFFVIEYYASRANTSYTPDQSGLIVYRVNPDFAREGNASYGVEGKGDYIYIFRPGDTRANEGRVYNSNLKQATLNRNRPEKGKEIGNETALFDPDTIYFSDGSNSGIYIKVTSETSDSVTFDLSVSDTVGTGTKEDPYQISSVHEFMTLPAGNPGKYFRLTSDLDFSRVNNYQGYDFNGTLDGGGHTIRNVTAFGTGLFKNIGNKTKSKIYDLRLEQMTASGNGDYIGTLASLVQDAEVNRVTVESGTVTNTVGTNAFASTGGFVGNAGRGAVFEDCYTKADVTGGPNIGGFIGLNQSSTIRNCFSAGRLANGTGAASGSVVGGFIGMQFNTEEAYQVPVNAYYDKRNAGVSKAVGAKYQGDHTSTEEGVVGVAVPEKMELKVSETSGFTIDTTPAVASVKLSGRMENGGSEVVSCDSNARTITANKSGRAVVQTFIPVGSYEMVLQTEVYVADDPADPPKIDDPKDPPKTDDPVDPPKTDDPKEPPKTDIAEVVEESVPSVFYRTHVQTYGWQSYRKNGQMSGTSGQAKRLEGINIYIEGSRYDGGIEYQTHVQSIGWQGLRRDNEMSGTSGQAKRLEAIRIRLTGSLAEHYDVYYRVHAQTYGWLGWAKNGESAGTEGLSKRLEGIEIQIVRKGAQAPGTTAGAFKKKMISYRTHVQTYGWQSYRSDGQASGTSGQAKRLEGIQIKLENLGGSGSVEYRTHVQTYGWESAWRRDGQMSGTSGQAKRLEAIQIRLTGDAQKQYDIYYRVHAQTYGWLGWAKNGESAGTEGLAKRLEAIEIRLVEKGSQAPGGGNPFVR